ncbi:hypothetical protein MAIC_43870 [Mycolicibacterium aichiense]|uniref:Uncharacterized protein n=1 Tax=Mycolicibacterium aichiense TaxID=1799 RepID=A0AAD1HQN2_9MYCO|nr:hypothetical protein MAIC_43870 [Mycolicibacterium aichiense]SUA14149.1 Uncharacterised protein [Mycolicibacterium aichiense]
MTNPNPEDIGSNTDCEGPGVQGPEPTLDYVKGYESTRAEDKRDVEYRSSDGN